MPNSIISLKDISKSYFQGGKEILVLDKVNLEIDEGEFISITGPSGSGKTTLLNIIALIDDIDSGSVSLFGKNISSSNEKLCNELRKNNFGFVYQSSNLFEDFNAVENIAISMILKGYSKTEAYNSSVDVLDQFGLMDRKLHFPNSLSGGEQQRVAIARAVVSKPKVIIADEPTGNLDKNNSLIIFDYLMNFVESENITVVMATHNNELASRSKREIKLI